MKDEGTRVAPIFGEANRKRGMISPIPFIAIPWAALLAQTSSAPVKCLFSDIGGMKGYRSKSFMSS